MKTLVVLGLLASPALAGSDSRECETADKLITMGGGNAPTEVHIELRSEKHPGAVHVAPVQIMPGYGYNVDATADDMIVAVPIAPEKIISRSHQHQHVTHHDGTTCDGRERWDDRTRQTYVLMAKGGEPLRFPDGTPPKYLTADGYLIADFRCHSFGYTSPGGCFADAAAGDLIEWK